VKREKGEERGGREGEGEGDLNSKNAANEWMDIRKDRPAYRDARTHLTSYIPIL
jgi:hypothetical protein